jgi:hypothetical protein
MMLTIEGVGLTAIKGLMGPTSPPWEGKPVECCSGIGSFHVEVEPYEDYLCVVLVCTTCGEGWWLGFTTTTCGNDPPRRGRS